MERVVYRFGPFSLDGTAKVLSRGDQPLHLTLKVVDTLLVLVRDAGQVVTKEEIMRAVWPDRIVEEANVAQNIAVIRRALAAEPGSPGYIETFPGRGYRLHGPVAVEAMPSGAAAAGTAAGVVPRSSWRRHWARLVAASVVIAAGSWLILSRRAPPEDTAFRIVPATRLPGVESQPAASPDGRSMAFVWTRDEDKTSGVWVLVPGETSPRPIGRSSAHNTSPAWAPDGRAIAYLRIGTSATEVVVADAGGGQERVVASLSPPNYGLPYRLLDWSPDGAWLVVSHSYGPDRMPGLLLVSVTDGTTTRLTQPRDAVGGDVDPRFSPDGRTISFIRFIHRSNQELFSIPVQGGAPRQLTSDGKQVSGHDWMPDGKAIVLASNRSGEFRLWKLPPALAGPAKAMQSLSIYGEFPIDLSVARKAASLVYTVRHQHRNIWRLDLKAKTDRWSRIVASSAHDASPQYSPAGDRICFRSDRSGEDQLWVCGADGSNPTQITRGLLWPSMGHWSADGRQIVFNNARTGAIYVATEAEDRKWTVRETGAVGYHPVISPDGQWIYAGTRTSIVRFPLAGGAAAEVTGTPGLSLGLSPDGRRIYFTRDSNQSILWMASVESGQISKVLEGLIPGCTSCWALTPAGVYYLGASRQSFDRQMLYFRDFATGLDREVAEYPEPLAPFGSGPFSLSPDLRYLLCVRMDQAASDVMRVEPFR